MLKIAASARVINGEGSMETVDAYLSEAVAQGLRIQRIEVAPLSFPWNKELPDFMLRGACSPMIAFERTREWFSTGKADVVVLSGRDYIKSDYEGRSEERNRLMEVYGKGRSFLTEYDKLAEKFSNLHHIDRDTFREYAAALHENHRRVYERNNRPFLNADTRWFNFVTEYFRGVDCANPNIDFEGALVLTKVPEKGPTLAGTYIVGNAFQQLSQDSPEYIDEIAHYAHLQHAYTKACKEAAIDFKALFLSGKALLEVYTCYPVVAMGFLLVNGFVNSLTELPEFLSKYPITLSGGLNLARAPANNTTLNHIISAVQELVTMNDECSYAGVHGNGSLGYQQGFTILRRF